MRGALFIGLVLWACDERAPVPPTSAPPLKSVPVTFGTPAASSPRKPAESVRVEPVELDSGRKVFVLRAARGAASGVFLHGLCGHGQGYLQSFQHSAAEYGHWIAPHGDAPCGAGVYRSWSADLSGMQKQIEAGLRVGGARLDQPITLVGYSQGATRALALARKYPERYDALILIAAPTTPGPAGLSHLRAAVMMSGERDRKEHMKSARAAFDRARIPSTFIELPGAAHGQMGSGPERVMGEALSFVARAKPRRERDGGS